MILFSRQTCFSFQKALITWTMNIEILAQILIEPNNGEKEKQASNRFLWPFVRAIKAFWKRKTSWPTKRYRRPKNFAKKFVNYRQMVLSWKIWKILPKKKKKMSRNGNWQIICIIQITDLANKAAHSMTGKTFFLILPLFS